MQDYGPFLVNAHAALGQHIDCARLRQELLPVAAAPLPARVFRPAPAPVWSTGRHNFGTNDYNLTKNLNPSVTTCNRPKVCRNHYVREISQVDRLKFWAIHPNN